MVNELIVRGFKYATVHVDTFLACFGPGRTNCIKGFVFSGGVPFVFREAIIIVGIDDCKLTMGEWNAAEGVAVAEEAVEKDRQN